MQKLVKLFSGGHDILDVYLIIYSARQGKCMRGLMRHMRQIIISYLFDTGGKVKKVIFKAVLSRGSVEGTGGDIQDIPCFYSIHFILKTKLRAAADGNNEKFARYFVARMLPTFFWTNRPNIKVSGSF